MSTLLKFLKELPDRYLLVLGFFSVMGFYAFYQSDAILQLMINFAVAIIALSQKKVEPQTQIQTSAVNTDSMDKSIVNTDSVNIGEQKDVK